jgi:hypothetical protein
MSAQLNAAAAEHGAVATFLAALIQRLSFTPWPVPVSVRRQLRVADGRSDSVEDWDADDLARRSKHLVVLGDPGSGKTWLARRAARLCAEAALTAMAEGASIDEVELPLYTTCSLLFSAAGDIRQAAVSSALDQLPSLGSPEVAAALRALFAEREARTLLVIDALDEAPGPDARLEQIAALPWYWRTLLTSRPAPWRYQIAADDPNWLGRVVGTLQPLRYPGDVEPFIGDWFRQRPDHGGRLVAQLAQRPALQPAAQVPLFLAFYCILGGDLPLPARRRDLHAQVIRRIWPITASATKAWMRPWRLCGTGHGSAPPKTPSPASAPGPTRPPPHISSTGPSASTWWRNALRHG